MTNLEALTEFVRRKKQEVIDRGGEMFQGIPEEWWFGKSNMERLLGCENGHVSRIVLKSEEHGSLCLACHKRVAMIPPGYTDETLAAAIAEIAQESGQDNDTPHSNEAGNQP